MTAFFRLIHVSDFHFGEISNVNGVFDVRSLNDWYTALRSGQRVDLQGTHCSLLSLKLARMLFLEKDSADAVLISGDLATTGILGDMAEASDFIMSKAAPPFNYVNRKNKPTLGSVGLPIFAMPGNHDRFQNHACAPASKNFERFFGHIWNSTGNVKEFAIFDDDNDEHLILLCADFCLRFASDASPIVAFMGQGHAYPDVISELKQLTDDIRSAHTKAGILWVSHFFPSQTSRAVPSSHMLRYSEDLIRAANDKNVNIILSGHLHENIELTTHRPQLFSAGSACAYGERRFGGNWIHALEIKVADKRAHLIRRESFQFQNSDFIRI